MNAGHEGLACTACTDFFRNFLLARRLASAVCASVADGYVKRRRGTLTVTLCDRLSWRVYYARREVRLRAGARLHEDQADLW